MLNKDEARERVRELKHYYTNLVVYGAISLVCFLIWSATGGGFWPIWVFLGFAISGIMQGIRLGVLPMLDHMFPFLRPDWEEKQLERLMGDESSPKEKTKSSPRLKDKE